MVCRYIRPIKVNNDAQPFSNIGIHIYIHIGINFVAIHRKMLCEPRKRENLLIGKKSSSLDGMNGILGHICAHIC